MNKPRRADFALENLTPCVLSELEARSLIFRSLGFYLGAPHCKNKAPFGGVHVLLKFKSLFTNTVTDFKQQPSDEVYGLV